ncbi:hypothetical protein D6T64_11810 [Cryobacterium melibiosiphilum]|uniref:AAA domain-containing protein n=1 Tax=Cryobacterium melibiosiphilum TaxID=995039 RepID=A0A3A5MLS6_9MICO|nr:hypothetical protein [Cryobacterium melibiosiphilum]RJT88068.1 hypothetical protein D6T64_11810 [Cryobacterium melibiosiphilum]
MTQTFKATNFKRLIGEATITPSGNELVVLAGKNKAGKSSFREAMQSLLKYASKLIPDPIHEGETESRAEFIDTELGVRLLRVWKRKADGTITSTFSAYALDGAKYPSAVALVAELTGGILLDPSEFVNFDEKKQREELLRQVKLPFDIDKLAAERKGIFDGRTDKNNEVKRLAAQLKGFAALDANVPTEQLSAVTLYAEMDAIRTNNEHVEQLLGAHEVAVNALEAATHAGRAASAALDKARADHTAALAAEKAASEASAQGQIQSTDAVTAQLASIDETNEKVREQIARAALADELDTSTAQADGLTSKLNAIDKRKTDGLAAAKFPVEGLSVDENGITVNGLSFLSLSESEQLWVALRIATAGNPKLKLIFLKNGDAFDDETLAKVQEYAAEKGWTIIADRGRDNSNDFGIVFEEGILAVSK